MKALINTTNRVLELSEVPLPEPKAGEVRIKTIACGICATDFEMIDGCSRSVYPQILGHEWTGVVDKVGSDVDNAFEGKLCVAENVLKDGGEVGFEHSGGYAEYFITESEKLQFLPENFSIKKAAMSEPLAVSVRALKRFRLEDKSNVLIFGDGPIGLIMLMILKREGVKNIGLIGGRKERLELAEKLGASFCVNYHDAGEGLLEKIREAGEDQKYTNFIEATGSGHAIDILFELASTASRILIIGDYGEELAHFKWEVVVHKELEIIGSNASAEAWEDAIELALSNNMPIEDIISHSFFIEDFAEAMKVARGRDFKAIKVLLNWKKEEL